MKAYTLLWGFPNILAMLQRLEVCSRPASSPGLTPSWYRELTRGNNKRFATTAHHEL